MNDRQPDGLEGALAKAEASAETALTAAAGVVKALRRYRSAAHHGQIRELGTATEAAKRALQALDQEVANVADGWDFDVDAHLQSGAFVDELIAAGRRADLRIVLQDKRLFSYPALLRVQPSERAVLIDKARERRIRPSALVRLLRALQNRPARFKALDFLQSLHNAYQVAVERQPGRLTAGSSVPLNELYDLFTMLPGAAREYSRQEFARDVYLLDQSGETRTRTGARIEFDASTGTKLPRGTLTIVAQNGQEKHYYAISFAPARGD